MPYRRLPNSIPSVIRVLCVARDCYKLTTEPAQRAFGADIFALLDDADPNSLCSRFCKEANDVDLALAAQAPLTTQLSQAAARLTMYASHFHQVLDLGITRGTFAAGARGYYGRDIHSPAIPDLSTYALVKEAAAAIVAGEAARQEAEGPAFVPMNLPSAAEVQAVRAIFVTAQDQSRLALARTDTEQEEAMSLYAEAQALAVDICERVEFFYRKDSSASSRRQKCIRWGVVYIYEPGETEPAESTTTSET